MGGKRREEGRFMEKLLCVGSVSETENNPIIIGNPKKAREKGERRNRQKSMKDVENSPIKTLELLYTACYNNFNITSP